MRNNILLAMIAAVVLTSGCIGGLQDDPNIDRSDEPDAPEENNDPEETEETGNSGENNASSGIDRIVRVKGFSDISYDTQEIEVEQGETIEFVYTNEGGTHDLVLEMDGEDVARTDTLSASGETDSFVYTFEEDGEYQFYCSVGNHRAQGMEGDIILS